MSLEALLAGTLAALVAATIVGQGLRLSGRAPSTVANMNVRIATWWVLVALTGAALLAGSTATCTLFGLFSAVALWEFGQWWERVDSPWLLILIPVQYGAIRAGREDLALLCVPVIALMWSAVRKSVRPFAAAMIAVYGLSHVALLAQDPRRRTLAFYVLLVTQASDVLQWICGKLWGRTPAAPRISPQKTVEGYAGGIVLAVALGMALHRATPFGPFAAAGASLALAVLGAAGGLVMSAIKRKAGVKDSGVLLAGHGGVLDRSDSLFLSAPAFYWLVRLAS